ncbi:MAG: FHA domain-containing protein [Phycisphaerae bacterium]|nr:FHA domain-containing protein [Phycisphaerae bacterium]
MATLLIATPDGSVVRRIPLDPQRAYALGRSPRCTIPLEPRSISRRHALLFRQGGTWWVADSGSSRGLRTEDGVTRFTPLTIERWVGIGPLVCWLLASTVTSTKEGLDDASDLVTEPAFDLGDSVDLEAETEGVHEESSDYLLLDPIAGGPAKLVHLDGVDHATIGSDPACAIRLPASDLVLPLHAVVFREPKSWALIGAGGPLMSEGQRFLRKRLGQRHSIELGGYRVRSAELERTDPAHDGSAVRPASSPVSPSNSGIPKPPPSAADLYGAPMEGISSVFIQPSKTQRFTPKGGETPLI